MDLRFIRPDSHLHMHERRVSIASSPFALLSRINRRSAYPIFRYGAAAVPLFGARDETLTFTVTRLDHLCASSGTLRTGRLSTHGGDCCSDASVHLSAQAFASVAIDRGVLNGVLARSLRLVPILRDDCLCSV